MTRYLKIIVALVVIVGALVWAVGSLQTRSYSGSNLNFVIGQGAVTVTNPDEQPVSLQLVSAGSRVFSVSSSIAGVSGPSVKQGTGSTTTQLFEFASPSGVSAFTVVRGTNVSLVTPDTTKLNVSVQSLSESDARTTTIIAIIAIAGGLYYISRTTNHRWIARLRGQAAPIPAAKPAAVSAMSGQGAELRAYGDNRTNIAKP